MDMIYGGMYWLNTLFVHWRVPQIQLKPYIPPGLGLDIFEGNAYVSLVALRIIGPAPLPLLHLGSSLLSYNQINIRTYVTSGSGRGIVLLNTLVDCRLTALAANIIGMPYRFIRNMDLKEYDNSIFLRISDLKIDGKISDTTPVTPPSFSLEDFLTDRMWVYEHVLGGLVYGIRIKHMPWRLRPVSLMGSLPLSVIGINGTAEPVSIHLAEGLDVSMVEISVVRWPMSIK